MTENEHVTEYKATVTPKDSSKKQSLLQETERVKIFFFQAEDGIRDGRVTGVQTCALPILAGTGVESLDPGTADGSPGAPSPRFAPGVVVAGREDTRRCAARDRKSVV